MSGGHGTPGSTRRGKPHETTSRSARSITLDFGRVKGSAQTSYSDSPAARGCRPNGKDTGRLTIGRKWKVQVLPPAPEVSPFFGKTGALCSEKTATMPPTTDTVAATMTSSPLPSEPIVVEKPAVAADLPTEPPAFGWKWGFASGKNGFTYGYGYGPSQGSVNFWNIGG